MRSRVDGNQKELTQQLRDFGCTVVVLSNVGSGCPDLLVGYRGRNYLMEVKDPSASAKDRRLRPSQQEFFDSWRGQRARVETIDEALNVLTGVYGV